MKSLKLWENCNLSPLAQHVVASSCIIFIKKYLLHEQLEFSNSKNGCTLFKNVEKEEKVFFHFDRQNECYCVTRDNDRKKRTFIYQFNL